MNAVLSPVAHSSSELFTVEPTYNGRRYNERSLSTNKGGATVKIYIGAMAQCLT